jgi:hypothetical protein
VDGVMLSCRIGSIEGLRARRLQGDPMMHTLLDPFEITARELPLPPVAMASLDELEVRFEDDIAPSLPPPSPDSSGRLRCWCSED